MTSAWAGNLLQGESVFHREKTAYDSKDMSPPATLPQLPAFQLLGQPVEISKIEKELKTDNEPEVSVKPYV